MKDKSNIVERCIEKGMTGSHQHSYHVATQAYGVESNQITIRFRLNPTLPDGAPSFATFIKVDVFASRVGRNGGQILRDGAFLGKLKSGRPRRDAGENTILTLLRSLEYELT